MKSLQITSVCFRSIYATSNHLRSLQINTDHFCSLQNDSRHFRLIQITSDRSWTLQINSSNSRSLQITSVSFRSILITFDCLRPPSISSLTLVCRRLPASRCRGLVSTCQSKSAAAVCSDQVVYGPLGGRWGGGHRGTVTSDLVRPNVCSCYSACLPVSPHYMFLCNRPPRC